MPSDTQEEMEMEENGKEHVFKWGDDERFNIPRANVSADLLWIGFCRAFPHVLSNEVASKVGGFAKRELAAGRISEDDAKTGSEWHKEQTLLARLAFVESVKNGTWGSGTRGPTGPRLDPLEVEFNRAVANACRQYLRDMVTQKKFAYDKEAKVWRFRTDDGTVHERTFDQALEGYENNLNEARKAVFMRQAEETVARKRREAEAAKADAALAAGGAEPILI